MNPHQYQEELKFYDLTIVDLKKINEYMPPKEFWHLASYLEKSEEKELKDVLSNWKKEKQNNHPHPVREIFRFKKIIFDNKKFIKNKIILEFGCHVGFLSQCCLSIGAKKITGTNVRKKQIEIAKILAKEYKLGESNYITSDIHDYKEVFELCQSADTVLLTGILHHVDDHKEILKKITESNVTNLIIEFGEHDKTTNHEEPKIIEEEENIQEIMLGWHKSISTNYKVGIPNYAWLKEVMMELGWKNVNQNKFKMKDQAKWLNRSISAWIK